MALSCCCTCVVFSIPANHSSHRPVVDGSAELWVSLAVPVPVNCTQSVKLKSCPPDRMARRRNAGHGWLCPPSSGFEPWLRPIAGAVDNQHFRAIPQTVQAGRRQERVEKDIGPLVRGAVAGQDDAALLVAPVDNVVQVAGRWRLERLEPEIVQHQQVRPQIGLQPAFPGAIGAATVEVLKQLGHGGEEGVKALSARLVNQCLGERGILLTFRMGLSVTASICHRAILR